MNSYRLLADATVIAHALFVLFVVGGQLLILAGWAWRWTWTRNIALRAAHLVATLYVVLEAWLGVTCPLTLLENRLRALAGEATYPASFIGYWLDRLLFYDAPAWVFTLVYTLFAVTVIAALLAYPPRRPRVFRHAQGGDA